MTYLLATHSVKTFCSIILDILGEGDEPITASLNMVGYETVIVTESRLAATETSININQKWHRIPRALIFIVSLVKMSNLKCDSDDDDYDTCISRTDVRRKSCRQLPRSRTETTSTWDCRVLYLSIARYPKEDCTIRRFGN